MRNILEQCLLFNLQNIIKCQGGNLPTVAHCHKKMLFILVCFWVGFFSYCSCKCFCNSKQREGHRTTAHMICSEQVCLWKNSSLQQAAADRRMKNLENRKKQRSGRQYFVCKIIFSLVVEKSGRCDPRLCLGGSWSWQWQRCSGCRWSLWLLSCFSAVTLLALLLSLVRSGQCPAALWGQSQWHCPVPRGSGALGAGEWGFPGFVHRRLQGSRAVPGQHRAGAAGHRHKLLPVLPGKGCCGFLQPGGCKTLLGALGSLPLAPSTPGQQQDPAEPLLLQPVGAALLCPELPSSCHSLQGSNPWSPGRSGRAPAAPQGCIPSTQSQY